MFIKKHMIWDMQFKYDMGYAIKKGEGYSCKYLSMQMPVQ